jgi:hypothetical protein
MSENNDKYRAAVAALEEHGSKSKAAEALGISRTTLRRYIDKARLLEIDAPRAAIEYPDFPDDDLPIEQIIDLQKRRFAKRHEHHRSKRWFPVRVKQVGPIGVSFFGDPHVDNNGCNWPMLEHHCRLHRDTDGLYGVNIGDTTDNWVGRLGRLYADSDTSKHTARKLAQWFLADSGVTWACWLLGNHDAWNEGDAILRGMNAAAVPMGDWQAQFRLVLPKTDIRVWAAHNFPGNSMWNTLHGQQRAAHTKDWAHIYVAGHTHNWGLHQEESASKDFVYWLARARGYKYIDDHAEHLGHAAQQEGAAITAIINPDSKTMSGLVTCYADMDAAADYLRFLQRKK